MKLKQLCEAASLHCEETAENMEIIAIYTDSRRVTKNSMFICIRGLHTDGHQYLQEAVAAGANCVVVERGASFPPLKGVTVLKSDNTRRAAAYLYHAWYGFPTQQLKIIGVTGTNGKTSVTHMLRAIFEGSLCRCGLIGTVGCESVGRHLNSREDGSLANMTTPDPEILYRILSEMVADRVEYVLMEVTSHALALEKLAPIQFEAAVFTNLTRDHLDFHGDMDSYADAKATLFAKAKLSVINADSPYASRMIRNASGRVVTCSEHACADYVAEAVTSNEDGVRYSIRSDRSEIKLFCPIPGAFTVMNSMQAAVCTMELGFGVSLLKDALSSLTGVRGRMERLKLGVGADFTVLIDYAHTPDALENLLRTARDFVKKQQRVVLLFGCGGDRDRSKRPMMGRIASLYADEIIVTSDNCRGEDPNEIIGDILSGIEPQTSCHVIANRAEAIRYAVLHARRGDVILLAGKGHEEYEIMGTERRPFSERELVRLAYAERRTQNKTEGTETET